MSKNVDVETTRKDIAITFAKWGITLYSIDRDREEYTSGVMKRGDGVKVSFLRKTGWQTVYCNRHDFRANLRAIYSFLDRIRIAEKEGVSYQELSSTKDLVKSSANPVDDQKEILSDAYDFMGVKSTDSMELIERIYKARATQYHPDADTGDETMMKRLNQAFDLIKKARGVK